MGLFKCEKCGCIENTALGWYWGAKDLADRMDWSKVGEEYKGKRNRLYFSYVNDSLRIKVV